MFSLEIDFEVLTPLFLGGAEGDAEVRPASFRGALRHWYRAIDVNFHLHEAHFFGGAGKYQGQSPFLLRVRSEGPIQPMPWLDAEELKDFDRGTGIETKNGLKYLGYIFDMTGEERRSESDSRNAITPGAKLHASSMIPRPERLTQQGWRAFLAAWWLLGHFGSLGTRARRGFGSLALSRWQVKGDLPAGWREDFEALPVLVNCESIEGWARGAEEARAHMGKWFPIGPSSQQPPFLPFFFGPGSHAVLFRNGSIGGKAHKQWGQPMQEAGLKLQSFRSAREPDRADAREHVRSLNGRRTGVPLSGMAPERTAFGLPLTFRFLKIDKQTPLNKEFTLQPAGTDARGKPLQRHPSPIWIRVVRLGNTHHALITRLDGTLPGQREGIRANPGAEEHPLSADGSKILDEFMQDVLRAGVAIKMGGQE